MTSFIAIVQLVVKELKLFS